MCVYQSAKSYGSSTSSRVSFRSSLRRPIETVDGHSRTWVGLLVHFWRRWFGGGGRLWRRGRTVRGATGQRQSRRPQTRSFRRAHRSTIALWRRGCRGGGTCRFFRAPSQSPHTPGRHQFPPFSLSQGLTHLYPCRFCRKVLIPHQHLPQYPRPVCLSKCTHERLPQRHVRAIAIKDLVDHLDRECEADDIHSDTFKAADDGLVGLVLKTLWDHGFEVTGPVCTDEGDDVAACVADPAAIVSEGAVEGGEGGGDEEEEGEEGEHFRVWLAGVEVEGCI